MFGCAVHSYVCLDVFKAVGQHISDQHTPDVSAIGETFLILIKLSLWQAV
jgi:hypothetical protein